MKNQKGLSQAFIIILVALLTAGIVGGGVWYWQQQEAQKAQEKNEKETKDLYKQLQEASKKDAKETKEEDDETEDWKTYTNEAFGISFKYPKTYTLTETGNLKAGEANTGTVKLVDKTRKGEPTLNLMFNPDGIGGCTTNTGDISYKNSALKNEKITLEGKEVEKTDDCGGSETKRIYFNILNTGVFSQGKNEIYGQFSYAKTQDYEDEFDKIIETFKVTKENLYK